MIYCQLYNSQQFSPIYKYRAQVVGFLDNARGYNVIVEFEDHIVRKYCWHIANAMVTLTIDTSSFFSPNETLVYAVDCNQLKPIIEYKTIAVYPSICNNVNCRPGITASKLCAVIKNVLLVLKLLKNT